MIQVAKRVVINSWGRIRGSFRKGNPHRQGFVAQIIIKVNIY